MFKTAEVQLKRCIKEDIDMLFFIFMHQLCWDSFFYFIGGYSAGTHIKAKLLELETMSKP